MIGQKEVLKQIDNLIEKGFPRFVVITGAKGQGKTEVAKYISKKLNILMIEIGTKIDDIREMIEMSYKQTEPIIFLIQNADKMSLGAKNSLLKVIEEPPNNAYFIMELQQMENTLETIKSRCQEIKMENYSIDELTEMINKIDINTNKEDICLIINIAQNYHEIKLLLKYGVKEFCNYVQKVYDNIYKVQSANSFKIADKLDLKDTGEGYNLELFWLVYMYKCFNELTLDNFKVLYNCIKITERYRQKLVITGINKQMLVDNWILDIRKEWINGNK